MERQDDMHLRLDRASLHDLEDDTATTTTTDLTSDDGEPTDLIASVCEQYNVDIDTLYAHVVSMLRGERLLSTDENCKMS